MKNWASRIIILVLIVLSTNVLSVDVLCRRCGARIAKLENLISDSAAVPPASAQSVSIKTQDSDITTNLLQVKNKVGQSFDIALFSTAQVKTIPSTRSVQDTFFPGYAWRSTECPSCGAFLGWSYDRPAECFAHDHDDHADEIEEKKKKVETVTATEVLINLFTSKPHPLSNCLIKLLGYWNIEWCYEKEVKQFHGTEASKRDPEYSLGKFEISKETTENLVLVPGTIGLRKVTKQYFNNGQKCDETGSGRTTIVTLACCINFHSSLGQFNSPFIAQFREPYVCAYELLICVSQLCAVEGYEPVKPSGILHQSTSFTAIDKQVCASGSPPKSSPRWFYGLIWSTLIHEKSNELMWVQALEPIVGTGQLM